MKKCVQERDKEMFNFQRAFEAPTEFSKTSDEAENSAKSSDDQLPSCQVNLMETISLFFQISGY
jgi:hypothetical protein